MGCDCRTVSVYVNLQEEFDDFYQLFQKLVVGDPTSCPVERPPEAGNDPEEEKETEVTIEEDDKYLRSLDPTEWKQHDHYKVLGLTSLRYKATAGQIKYAYRQLVLRHHPDKRAVPLSENQTDYFPCITKSYELLSDVKSRMSYDSVDTAIDDSVPKLRNITPENFLSTLRPVFERNGRWSVRTPVPSLGDDNASYDDIMNFYKFWVNFQSWREFSFLDEEEKDKGGDREERRYIDKLNKAERAKRRNAEHARIRQLVEMAMTNDPRLKRRRDEEKQRKQDEKDRKRLIALKKEEEIKAEEEAAKKEREEKNRIEALRLEEEKKEKDALKKAFKQQRKVLRDICKKHSHFSSDEDYELRSWWLENIDVLCTKLSLPEFESLNSRLSKLNKKEQIEKFLREQISSIQSQLDDKKKVDLQVQQNSMKQTATTDGVASESNSSSWSNVEIQSLVKAIQLLPPGTDKRWVAIANFINNHVHDGKEVKTAKQVVSKAKTLNNIGNSEAQQAKEQVIQMAVQNLVDQQNETVTSAPSERFAADDETWSNQDQKLLEAALKNYPPDTDKRWDKISTAVPGKSKKSCMKRYKEIVELLKAKKAAQKGANK